MTREALPSDLFAGQRKVVRQAAILIDDQIETFGKLAVDAFPVARQLHGKIAVANCRHRGQQLLHWTKRCRRRRRW
jgi:hypothetical protein